MLLLIWNSLRRITSTGSYDAKLDGLRALAILPVIIYHTSLRSERLLAGLRPLTPLEFQFSRSIPLGDSGVFLFFFISGYIIAYPFLRAAAKGASMPSIGPFYKRRLLRLTPPYVIALTAAMLMLMLSGYAPADAPQFNKSSAPLPISYLASLFYIHNITFGAHSRILPPLWTLEVEMQFYLVAPIILFLYLAIDERIRTWALLLVSLVIFLVIKMPIIQDILGHQTTLSFPAFAPYFLLGILFSDLEFGEDRRLRWWCDFAAVTAYAILLIASVVATPNWTAWVLRDAVMLASTAALFWSSTRGRITSRCLSYAPICVVGGACYSIYLTHEPVIQIASVILKHVYQPHDLWMAWLLMLPAIPLTILAGLIFFTLIERPTMRPDWPKVLARKLRRHRTPSKIA